MSTKIHAVVQALRQNYTDPVFNVTSLADRLGISASYLREVVYTAYGVSPQQLLETIRLEHALRALAQNGEIIDVVRLQAGYAYAKSFRRAFKKRVGMTPKECRQRLAQAPNRETELQHMLNMLRLGRPIES